MDENPYYSGSAAAFNIQEAEEWVSKVNQGKHRSHACPFGGSNVYLGAFRAAFAEASTYQPEHSDSDSTTFLQRSGRQYNLALAPEIVYSGSAFRRYLVTSQAHRQVGFLPVGSWWLYTVHDDATGSFEKVPNTREDLLGDTTLDFAAKRRLVKILRFIADYDSQDEVSRWEQYRDSSFSKFLSDVFKAPISLLASLLALTMSMKGPDDVTTGYALPRIARHLRSIGTLGKFSALIPKYGGLDEFCQVACRACAVGGGVYVLGKGLSPSLSSISTVQVTTGFQQASDREEKEKDTGKVPAARHAPATGAHVQDSQQEHTTHVKLHLKDGEAITARWIVSESSPEQTGDCLTKSVSIVSSSLSTLFPPVVVDEQPFHPGSAIVVFPSGSLELSGHRKLPPVHIHVHSSESGECPAGQSKFVCSLQPFIQATMMIDFRILIYIVRIALTTNIL